MAAVAAAGVALLLLLLILPRLLGKVVMERVALAGCCLPLPHLQLALPLPPFLAGARKEGSRKTLSPPRLLLPLLSRQLPLRAV